MCRKADCAYLRENGYCLMHREGCNVQEDGGKCPDGVEKVTEYSHNRQTSFMNQLRLCGDRSRKGACLHPNRRIADGFNVFKTCKRKTRFVSVERARKVAVHAERHDGTVLAVYECPFCHGYHLTRQLRAHLLWHGNEALGLPA